MKKEAFILFLTILIFIPIAFAQSIDAPIKKVTYHAEQYEVGNINYAQLIVYISSLSKDMAEEMGAISQDHDPVLKIEQLESALGKPTESTKWVWVEGEEREKRLDEEVPAWRKIIFDGKKIQIWLNAWPNVISKNGEDLIIYRLHLDIVFKKPEEQIDIENKIEEIKSIAEAYKENLSGENLENLAKESTNAEKLFNSYFSQNPGKCEEVMNNLFGSENKRDDKNMFAQEIVFYEGDNFESKIRLEMCDECEWAWINLNMWFEGRGNFERPDENIDYDPGSKRKYESLSHEDFKRETTALVEKTKSQLAEGEYKSALDTMQELRVLTEAWNENANNVWKEIESKYKVDWDSMTQEEREQCSRDYCWIKKEQERRLAERELRNANYQSRKEFYSSLFSNYEKKEFYYQEEEWEKRIVEQFKEFGEEICSNNIDDNNNDQIDCSDSQCGGKICGYDIITSKEDNTTVEKQVELYCIAGSCQAKEEIAKEKAIVCGNHICEENEQETCAGDCATCFEYKPLECIGNVMFSGEDEKGCPLEPVCLAERESCNTDDDCTDPLCGSVSCIEGSCQVTELTECKEIECIDGEEKIQNCESGDRLVTEKCIEGLWIGTGIQCEVAEKEIEEEEEKEETRKEECVVKSDCGNDNDVCSNGECVTLPESIGDGETEEQEIPEPEEQKLKDEDKQEEQVEEPIQQEEIEEIGEVEEVQEQPSEQPGIITGGITLSFFKTLAKFTGFVVDEIAPPETETAPGAETPVSNDAPAGENQEENLGEQPETQPGEQQPEPQLGSDEQQPQPIEEERSRDEFDEQRRDEEDRRNEQNRRNEEDLLRREKDCNDRCGRECYDRELRPCAEECIWEECGNELECNIDEVKVRCESKCESESNVEACKNTCFDKCMEGEETWVEPERKEHKEEKFVFTVGGSCRTAQGKKEGFIWFGGWGDNFDDFHLIKNKYHSRGESDWCKNDLENLMKQRKELEKSMNEKFAYWFFEKYVANSATDWEKHISGIFELYWRDVDISRQLVERSQCLREYTLPEHELINFKYDTEYGSVEFWEEIKTTNKNGKEVQIISPYMKTWLFPSKEFFKAEMRRAMERHELPGSEGQERRNTLTEEEKIRLMENSDFIENIREFNEKYGENLVVQFKDFDTGEVVINIYMRLNEEELIYFEPMLPSEIPAEDVRIEFDVNKLLDIIEYEESGRIELESPPWDKRPRTGTIKNVIDGARMFFMFMNLLNSAQASPSSAEGDAKFFVRNFFQVILGNDEEHREGSENGFDEKNIPEDWKDKGGE
ncbi:hypothetical protein HY500_00415 [Candidatus Woesearchaeota archaeon]|nr:hypothetical protein [Candidatus Woesearchaeota archaeon]